MMYILFLFIVSLMQTYKLLSSFNLQSKYLARISVNRPFRNGKEYVHTTNINAKLSFLRRKPLYNLMSRYTSGQYDARKSDLVLDDMDQIIEAIYIFKRVYGDLEISTKFEVPASDKWPSYLHGLRLGRRLEQLLSSQEFFDDYPDYVNEIKKTGLEPHLEALVDDWKIIYEALKIYKELYGDVRVPSKYVVPDNEPWPRLTRTLRLGSKVAAIRSAARFVKDRRDRKAALDALGFEWRIRDKTFKPQQKDESFDRVITALVHYKRTVDDKLMVNPEFVVPNDEGWPVETWGMKLGDLVQSIREKDKLVISNKGREERLNDIGFPREESKREVHSRKSFDIIYSALVVYRDVFGNLLVPQSFTIPSELPWPEITWGLKLGVRVNAMRSQGTLVSTDLERKAKLDDLGFIWNLPSEKRKRKAADDAIDKMKDTEESEFALDDEDEFREFMKSDSQFSDGLKRRDSGSSIHTPYSPKLIKEPEISDVPKKALNRITAVPSRYTEDNNIPTEFDPSRMFEPLAYREISARAMREYLYSRDFSDDPDIREVAHFEGGMTPEKFHRISIREIPEEDIAAMKKIGYRILEFGKYNWEVVIEALRVYSGLYGNIDVPFDYVITEEYVQSNVGFNRNHEGLALGDAVEAIRIGDVDGYEDPERREVLDSMHFKWGDPGKYLRFRFYPMILALRIFRHLYAVPMPLYNFVVPDEYQWPYWMAGMPLGEWSTVCRVQQKMLAVHYPKRKEMLTAMDFAFWIPPGPIPRKYYEPLV